jgi:uncharacterized protein (TIGR03435 family)
MEAPTESNHAGLPPSYGGDRSPWRSREVQDNAAHPSTLPALASAQASKFDAADIHASADDFSHGGFTPGGRLELRGYTLLDTISLAYSVERSAVTGGPNWLDDDRFDISAKGSTSPDPQAGKKMLQALLADRFHLEVHIGEKPTPVFLLIVAKKSARIVRSEAASGNCEPSSENGIMTARCLGVLMTEFARDIRQWAGRYLSRPVIDKTGLTGGYDFTLHWAIDPGPDLNQSIFKAAEDQLGLKFVPGMEPLPTLSVDRVDRTPTPNVPGIAKLLGKYTQFEIADLKPSRPEETRRFRRLPGGRVEVEAEPLQFLFLYGFMITEDRVENLPKWLESDTYDLSAKSPSPDLDTESLRAMLRSLLADRFGLKTHYEDRPQPVYVLTAPKHATKLTESDGSVRSNCKSGAGDYGQTTLTCQNMTMAQFAMKIGDFAGSYFDHPVIDRTGLTGSYDFTISWTSKRRYLGDSASGDSTAQDPPGGVTAFQAVEKLLGGRVESQKQPRPVLVIDHIERKPTDN